MKLRTIMVALFCVVLLVSMTAIAPAQNQRTGTVAAPELLIPVGGRDLAMGGASLATSAGVEAIYWNPAGLNKLSGSAEGLFSSMSYIGDIGVSYGAVAGKFGDFGVVGLSLKSLSFGSIPLTTEDDPEGASGRFFSPTYVTVGFSYSRGLTDAISFGMTAKLISEQIDRVSSSGFAFDFGIQYASLIGLQGLNLGVSIKNIGPQMKFDGPGLYREAVATSGTRPAQKYKSEAASFELPALVEIGVAYAGKASDNMMWNVDGAFSNNNLYYDEFRLGGELEYKMDALSLFGRAGFNALAQGGTTDSNIFGPTFGLGVGYAMTGVSVTVDYAYRSVQFFDANQVFSVKLGF